MVSTPMKYYVAGLLQWYRATIREQNRQTLQRLAHEEADDDELMRRFHDGEIDFTSENMMDRFDEIAERFNLDGVVVEGTREYSDEYLEPQWSALRDRVRESAKEEFKDTLELPLELKVLFTLVDNLIGPDLPRHRACIQLEINGGFSPIPVSQDVDFMDCVEAYDSEAFVEIGAGWPIGDQDTSGYIPWAIWCRVLGTKDKQTELRPWGWRYVICPIEAPAKLHYDLKSLLEHHAIHFKEEDQVSDLYSPCLLWWRCCF